MQRIEFKVSTFVLAALIGVASVLYLELFATPAESVPPLEPTLFVNDVPPTLPLVIAENACPDSVSEQLLKKMLEEPEIAETLRGDRYDCSHLRYKNVDLNHDGHDEHFVWMYVSSMCGSKSNCPSAIFSETSNGLRKIYYHPAKLHLEVLKSKARGYSDIESTFNSGVYGQYVEVLRFNGVRYLRTKCFDRYADESLEKVECWESD